MKTSTITKVVAYDRLSDASGNTCYIVYLKRVYSFQGQDFFKKSSIVVEHLPANIVGATVTVDWKSNTIKKVGA